MIRIDWLIDHPVGMIVLVRVEVVDVGQAKIYMGVVMMPLGKVVVHHWAKGWRKQGPKSQHSGPCHKDCSADYFFFLPTHPQRIIYEVDMAHQKGSPIRVPSEVENRGAKITRF